ncbi:cGMP-dependent protein kinase, isozyme 1 [Trichonephila clavipes]|nr:cGMP-dependent protein kinase, isozyme 1 [Trichonephila clavipes]
MKFDIEEHIRYLGKGDYFGERALLKSFKELIGDLRELQDKQYEYNDAAYKPQPAESEKSEYDDLTLDDLEVIVTLGVGGFGRVDLVRNRKDENQTFALKCLKKVQIVSMEQQHHVINEKVVMMSCRHPFICRIFIVISKSMNQPPKLRSPDPYDYNGISVFRLKFKIVSYIFSTDSVFSNCTNNFS